MAEGAELGRVVGAGFCPNAVRVIRVADDRTPCFVGALCCGICLSIAVLESDKAPSGCWRAAFVVALAAVVARPVGVDDARRWREVRRRCWVSRWLLLRCWCGRQERLFGAAMDELRKAR